MVVLSLAAALFALALIAAPALASKEVTQYFGSASGSGELAGQFNNPRDVAVNSTIYVADEANNRIERFLPNGVFAGVWGANAIHRDEIQTLTVNATSGTFALTFEGDTTGPIAYNASASAVDNALDVLPSIGGDANVNVTSSGSGGNQTHTIVFTAALGGTDLPQLEADATSLTGTASVNTTKNGSGGQGTDYEICTVGATCGAGAPSGGNGTAAGNGALDNPQSVAVDKDTGNLYVSDRDNKRVNEYDGEGNFIRSFGWNVVDPGTTTFGAGDLSAALGIAAYGTSGEAYVSSDNEVHVFGPAPARAQSATFDGSDSDAGAFEALRFIDVDQSNGTVYAIDNRAGGAVIDKFDSSGSAQDFSALGSSSLSGADVSAPDGPLAFDLGSYSDIAVDNSATASEGRIYVLQQFGGVANNTAFAFAPDGTYLHKITLGGGDTACGIAVDNSGEVWISDLTSSKAVEYDASGAPTGQTIDTSAQNAPCHIAFDGSDNLYAGEHTEGGALYEYDSAGAFEGTVDTGPVHAVAYDPSSGGILATHSESASEYSAPIVFSGYQVCEAPDVCKAGEGGNGVGQIGATSSSGVLGIAVSPPDGNASTGKVFLADTQNQRVNVYNLDGTSPSSFGSSANFASGQPTKVAVDSRGIVYASDSNGAGRIQRYDAEDANGGGVGFLAPIGAPVNEQQTITFAGFSPGNNYTLTCPNGEPTGELTYTTGEDGRKIVQQGLEEACGAGNFSTSGSPPTTTVTFEGAYAGADQPQMICTKLSGGGSCSVSTTTPGTSGPLLPGSTSGLAVDPGEDILYVLRDPSQGNTVVQQFGPANEPGQSAAPTAADDVHGAGIGFTSVLGLGLDEASGNLYVSAANDVGYGSAHRVYRLGDAVSIGQFSFPGNPTNVTDHSVTLHATVNPEGALIGCAYEYSTDRISWTEVPEPDCASLDVNGGSQSVSQEVSGLIANTKYFVRLRLIRPFFSGFAPVIMAPNSFTTATASPIVSEASARTLDDHSVRVAATIDPSHSPTSYVVQYGTTPSLGSSTAPVQIGEGSAPLEVSSVIGGLKAATTYYFKLVATNLSGSAASSGLKAGTFNTPPSFDPCPNDQFRTGPSAHLPDCRAYEQVTPTDKSGSDAFGDTYSVQGSPSGDGVTFFTFAGFPGGEGFPSIQVFRSGRDGGSWSTKGLLAPPSFGNGSPVLAWTSDLSLSFNQGVFNANATEKARTALLMRDSSDGSFTTVLPYSQGGVAKNFGLAGTYDNNSKVVFETQGPAPVSSGPASDSSKFNLYLYDRETGDLTLGGLLPDSECGTPPCPPIGGARVAGSYGALNNTGEALDQHVVSSVGDLYFVDNGTGQLYVRRDAAGPDAATVPVSASEATIPDPNGTFVPDFWGATPDGSHAFLTSEQELTDGASTASGTQDLYRFDKNAPAGSRLTDVAPGADVRGVLGFSEDGSYIYFAANADLDGSGQASAGDCSGSDFSSGTSVAGQCSLYLWHAGEITFISRLDLTESTNGRSSDATNWLASNTDVKTARVSPDGKALLFRSQRSLTGYDNEGSKCKQFATTLSPGACPEFYRYEVDSQDLNCVTCNPTGAPPLAVPTLKNGDLFHAFTSHTSFNIQPFLSRNLSPDGKRIVFQTPDKLVPEDVNGDQSCPGGLIPQYDLGSGFACQDVYEWEAPGKGACTTQSSAYSSTSGGCIYLLSTGTGAYPAYLGDVSESGDTVFIFSRQQLVPADKDSLEDIYAVSVDGGLASQHMVPPATCEGDACRGASSKAPDVTGAGSAAFEGPGNPKSNANKTRCPKGKRQVRAKGKVRCVVKGHKRKQKRHHKRAANSDRRASR